MSMFDAGFIMWGFFALYALLVLAYYVWMHAENKKDKLSTASRGAIRSDRA